MKNPLDRDDFEFYLEQEVNQHRMYPSDHIWRNIQQDIHGYKKWPALTVITLFVISALVVGTILIKPQHQLIALAANTPAQKAAEAQAEPKQQPAENMQEHFSPEHITQQTIAGVARDIDITDNIKTALSAYNNNIQDFDFIPAGNATAYMEPVYTSALSSNNDAMPVATEQKQAVAKKDVQPPVNNQVKNAPVFANLINLVPNDDVLYGSLLKLPKSSKPRVHNGFMFSIFEKIESASPYAGLTLENNFSSPVHKPFNFKPRNPRLEFSLYAAPSISYRHLSYSNQAAPGHTYISGLPYNAGYTVDVSRATRNRPASGYEVGAALGYKLNNVLTLRGGLQFNMREYDIEAYKLSPQSPSTSSFMPQGGGNSSSLGGVDVSSPTSASLNGNDRITLQNRYYQIAVPLGLDVRAWKSGRFAVGVAGSVQPTYIFDKDPFIITSDYKSYIDGSKLVRNWNVNTALETYLSYSAGKFKWQIGPQFRYQLLSTLSGSYPIREHLLDYGVKIGVVKSLR